MTWLVSESNCTAKIHSDDAEQDPPAKKVASLVFKFHSVLKTVLTMSFLTDFPSLFSFLALHVCNIFL
jgi:hypothetical protein